MNVTPLRPETVDTKGNRVIPNVSIETGLLVEKFKAQKPLVETGYAELMSDLGCNMLLLRRYISSARRILLRDRGILLETVRGVGVRVATNSGILRSGARDMGCIPRALGRASRKFGAVEYKTLTADEQREYTARVTNVGALKLLSAPSTVKRIEREGAADLMPAAKVLEMFLK